MVTRPILEHQQITIVLAMRGERQLFDKDTL